MNYRMMLYILGHIMHAEALLLLLPAGVSIYYGEAAGPFLITAGILLALGFLSKIIAKPRTRVIYAKEGFLIVGLCWLMLSAFGGLPFFLEGCIPNYTDCFFEAASGFTTTGASILTDVEALPQGMLFWRSFTHWIGGMGVLVFVLSIIPLAGDRSMHLMRAEVPGPTVGKLVPKIAETSRILYGIYIVMTLIEIVLLIAGGMPVFDSVVHSFGTAGTGGFGIKNNSVGFYDSAYLQGVITVFMILFGINFNLYYLLLIRKVKSVFKSEELRWYLGIIAAAIVIITINILPMYGTVEKALQYSSFQVGSIITTTGYSTVDFNLWPQLSRTVLILLMIFGACAGSTGGGIKTSRLIILVKTVWREIKRMLHPRTINTVKLDGRALEEETISSVGVFFVAYILIILTSVLLLSTDGYDTETNLTAVLSCINNIGPGLSLVGPMGNFSGFSDMGKWLLSLNMLIGRLEIFPMLMVFVPAAWKRK